MPTSTFFNLPPPKKEKLLRAAMAEFARKPFNQVSINKIIQAAEIPRGSFYQYFTGKDDLFRFILARYSQKLEATILVGLDHCGGDLLALPLALFDSILSCVQENLTGFQVFLDIVRQNAGMDASQLWDFMGIVQKALVQADFSRLNVSGQEEKIALLDLLFSSAGQALMAVCCGKASMEECRERLSRKIDIIRRGAEIKEEPC